MYTYIIIFNTVGVMLRTDDTRRRTLDDGRRTMDAGPSTPYYKLTGELKIKTKFWMFQGQFDLEDKKSPVLELVRDLNVINTRSRYKLKFKSYHVHKKSHR